ncbi:hypothetical protein RHM66_26440 [Pseudomonas sp. RTB3]|nr:hypothetical protein RHM66_26440 [Pseudomonas sp. RTB3]
MIVPTQVLLHLPHVFVNEGSMNKDQLQITDTRPVTARQWSKVP